MSDDDRKDQSPCCGDSDCCKPTSTDGSRQKSHWRTVIFTFVLLLASAVAAYSLFLREQSTADAGCCPSGTTTTAACCPTPAISAPAQNLTWTDFSFVVILRADDELPRNVTDILAAASDEIGARAIRPQTVTLRPDDPAFEATVMQYQITKFPAILVLGKSSAVTLTTDDISRDSLMSLYATNAIASSVPGN